jgi:tetraprenyl-beta-curcumene synthase
VGPPDFDPGLALGRSKPRKRDRFILRFHGGVSRGDVAQDPEARVHIEAMTAARDAIAVGSALAVYRRSIVPRVRRELLRWKIVAEAIPDPTLRAHALAALREKGSNVEATAVFAILVPRRCRGLAVGAMAAFQVAVDYLDSLGEQDSADPLANGLQLHRALGDALSPGTAVAEWYRLHPQREDGGYLQALVTACRQAVGSLPSHSRALPLARRAAGRCGEGQSYTHLAAHEGAKQLQVWALQQECPPGYLWWEIAAGASSSVTAHALIAAAADPRCTLEDAALIDAAYFPAIGALSVLLDDLVDLDDDLAAGAHNYTTYYASNLAAADRLALISARARAASAQLAHGRRHAAILSGIAGFYLSKPEARTPYAEPIRSRIIDSLGLTVRPILAAMRFLANG